MPLTEYAANDLLLHLFSKGAYMSLHTAEPDSRNSREASGGGYLRLHLDFSKPDGRAAQNENEVIFDELRGNDYTHFGLWDAVVDGNLKWTGALRDSDGKVGITVKNGEAIRIKRRYIVVSLQSREV